MNKPNNKGFQRSKPKSTSRSASRGAPSSAPILSAPRAPRYSPSTSRYSPSRGAKGSSGRYSNNPKFVTSYASRGITKHAPSSAPRIIPKISTRMAPDYAPRIAHARVSRDASIGTPVVASKNNTSWGNEAEWYDNYLADSDSYQKQIIMPNIIRIINPTVGQKVLDVACGQGLFSESMIDKGANVVGVDISNELITVAKNRFKDKISENDAFIVSPAHKMISAGVEEKSCDSAMCILAAQNIEEFDIALKESAKILKPKGKMVIVLNHPCFRVPKNSDWYFDAEGGGPEGDPSYTIVNGKKAGRYGRVVYSYMSEEVIKIDMHPGEKDRRKKSYTTSFHRPMQVYSKWLANAGFAILRIEEWTSHKKSNPGTRELADKRCKKEIPLFMCIEAVLWD
ncbi:MAG: methyltransferase domain-containing protein [bacterium]